MKRLFLILCVFALSWSIGWYFFYVDCAAVNCVHQLPSQSPSAWPIFFMRECCGEKPFTWFAFEVLWLSALPVICCILIFKAKLFPRRKNEVVYGLASIVVSGLFLCCFIRINEISDGPTEILTSISGKYPNCTTRYSDCANMFIVDCNSAADGPKYYISGHTGVVLGNCGGSCWRHQGSDCEKGLCPPLRGRICEFVLGKVI